MIGEMLGLAKPARRGISRLGRSRGSRVFARRARPRVRWQTTLPMETSAAIGRVLARRYCIVSFLGSGSMSSVYRATQTDGPDVAVKLLRAQIKDAEAARERLFREAQVIARLDHPGCVRLLDWGVEDGSPFVVLELVEGESLGEVLRRRGTLPEGEAASIIAEVCPVLEAAHSLGVVHRDLKPGNIMLLGPRGGAVRVKVLDFGLARLLPRPDADETQPKELTRPGSTLGTPSYMAPEQVRGANVDGRADIYSCGVILFEMVAASLPIIGENAIDTMLRQATEAPRSLREVVPGIAVGYADTVARCLAKSPLERYQNARELREELAQLEPPSAVPDTSTAVRAREPDPDQTTTRLRPLGPTAAPPPIPSVPVANPSAPGVPPAQASVPGAPPARASAPGVPPAVPSAPLAVPSAPLAVPPPRAPAPSSPASLPPPKAPPPPRRGKRAQRDSATQLRPAKAAPAPEAEPRVESKTPLRMPAAPKVNIVDREATQVRSPGDVTDFESTIPAVRPSSPARPLEVLDPEATVPAVYPKGGSPDGTTRMHEMAHWATTRKMAPISEDPSADETQALGQERRLVETGTLVRVVMPSPSQPAPSRPAPGPSPSAPRSSSARSPDASHERMPTLPFPQPRAPQPSHVALAEVLSGMPREERRWLIGAAVLGVAVAIALAVWLLL
jgi:serine/threonine-protein kinase